MFTARDYDTNDQILNTAHDGLAIVVRIPPNVAP